jgi:hypothetical protein
MNKEAADSNEKGDQKKKKKNVENQDMTDILKNMMYGFGDDKNPNEETIKLLEKFMLDFLQDLAFKSYKRSLRIDSNSKEIHKSDVLFFIRKDKKKYLRALWILKKHTYISELKKRYLTDKISPLEAKEDNYSMDENTII